MSLLERLKSEIAAGGPIGVDVYMTRCLHDPKDGYYATRPALGEDGDFITAPMVSQMFGELIGLWAVETWRRMGAPARVLLVEMGPGDGSLMSDALRAAKLAPDFLAAADLWLVETSKPLIERQRAALAGERLPPRWIDRLEVLPDEAPLLLLANEFLDCLPTKQFVRTAQGLSERVVGLDGCGELAFGLGPSLGRIPPLVARQPRGTIIEVPDALLDFSRDLGETIARRGGAALLIDYGRSGGRAGDTLQALRRHQKVDPLTCPGEADLTMRVDFEALCGVARAQDAQTALLDQGAFLRRLGIEQRAAALAAARPDEADRIGRQLDRLIGEEQMGSLFKAACIHDRMFTPPAFEDAAWPS
jgi:NADH dehydrogenase [ubiquinone] 1 alpha subcomplex assembly factor 7